MGTEMGSGDLGHGSNHTEMGSGHGGMESGNGSGHGSGHGGMGSGSGSGHGGMGSGSGSGHGGMGSGHGYGYGSGHGGMGSGHGYGSGGERPIELVEEGEYPVEIPDDECCAEKTVGGIRYYLVGTGETEVYNCLDNCIYHSANPRDVWQYCFKPGRQPVQCNDATVTPSAGHHHPTPDPIMDHEMEGHSMGPHGMGSHEMEGHSMGSHEMEG